MFDPIVTRDDCTEQERVIDDAMRRLHEVMEDELQLDDETQLDVMMNFMPRFAQLFCKYVSNKTCSTGHEISHVLSSL